MNPLTQTQAWQALTAHHKAMRSLHLRDLFRKDPDRGTTMTCEAEGIYLDYSKNRATAETLRLLMDLARERGLGERIAAMFRGDRINVTENRSVLHVALRAPRGTVLEVDGQDVVAEVHQVLDAMAVFAEGIRAGTHLGFTRKPIRTVVNIGIGGSDLGPAMVYEALKAYTSRDLQFRFVSNVDATDFKEATRDLDPATTLFIVASKTFTTQETMANAQTARAWALAKLKDPAAVNKDLKLLFLGCGTEDTRYPAHTQMNDLLTKDGIHHEFHSTPGEHEWRAWRHLLAEFMPELFQSKR